MKVWLKRAVAFHLVFAVAYVMILQPGMLVYLFLLPPALFFTFEAWLFGLPKLLNDFPFLALPGAIGIIFFGSAFMILRRIGLNWAGAMIAATNSGAIVFAISGNVYVDRLQRQEAYRLGATCSTSRGFYRDLTSLQYWDQNYSIAHGSVVVGDATYLWSYRDMTYARLFNRGPLENCIPILY